MCDCLQLCRRRREQPLPLLPPSYLLQGTAPPSLPTFLPPSAASCWLKGSPRTGWGGGESRGKPGRLGGDTRGLGAQAALSSQCSGDRGPWDEGGSCPLSTELWQQTQLCRVSTGWVREEPSPCLGTHEHHLGAKKKKKGSRWLHLCRKPMKANPWQPTPALR